MNRKFVITVQCACVVTISVLLCSVKEARAENVFSSNSQHGQHSQWVERLKEILRELESTPEDSPEVKRLQQEYRSITCQIARAEKERRVEREQAVAAVINEIRNNSYVVCGSATAHVLTKLLYAEYRSDIDLEKRSELLPQLLYETGYPDEVVSKVLGGKCAFGIIDRELSKTELAQFNALVTNGNRHVAQLLFARAVTVIIVNSRNPMREMTVKQVEAAFRTHDGNWKEFGGWNRPIDRIGTVYPLISWNMFTKQVLGGERVEFHDQLHIDPNNLPQVHEIIEHSKKLRSQHPGSGPYPRFKSDEQVIREVANGFNTIGYCLLRNTQKMPDNVKTVWLAMNDDAKAFAPVKEHILLEEYPLTNTLWLVSRPDASEQTKAFLQYATSDAATSIIRKVGMHPLTDRPQFMETRRIAAMKRGEGPKISLTGSQSTTKLARTLALERTRAKGPIQLQCSGLDEYFAIKNYLAGKSEMLILTESYLRKLNASHIEKVESYSAARHTIGIRAVALVTHSKNKLKSITLEQAKDILHGKINNWSELGGENTKIKRYGVEGSKYITSLLYKTAIDMHERAWMEYKKTDSDTLKAVMFDESGIAYVNYTTIDEEHIATKDNQAGVNILAINTGTQVVEPNAKTMSNGSYPYSERIYLYVAPHASDDAKAFAQFITEHNLQEVMCQNGILQTVAGGNARAEEKKETENE